MGKLCCYSTISFNDMKMFYKSVNLLEKEKMIIDLADDEGAFWRMGADVKLLVLKGLTSVDYTKIIKRLSDLFKVRSPFVILTQCDVTVLKCVLQYQNLSNVLSHNLAFEQDINDYLREQLVCSEESYEF